MIAIFFPVVILDRKDDPDSRDLVLTTQAMVREVVRGKTPPPANKKVKPSQNDLTRTVWTLRTSLRKLSLAKDIRIVPLLWIKLDWTFLFATDTRYYLKCTHKKTYWASTVQRKSLQDIVCCYKSFPVAEIELVRKKIRYNIFGLNW